MVAGVRMSPWPTYALVVGCLVLVLQPCVGKVVAKKEEHWAEAGCRDATKEGSGYEHHRENCIACVHATAEGQVRGDPTRCHACLKPHKMGTLPDHLMNTCLACVPNAEAKHLGWACMQYCAHHTWDNMFMTEVQATDCNKCLYAEFPADKWGCHVCMEQLSKDLEARRDCYDCIEGNGDIPGGRDAYECAACARVPEDVRGECWACMLEGTSGKKCALKWGVKEFAKALDSHPIAKHFKEQFKNALAGKKIEPFNPGANLTLDLSAGSSPQAKTSEAKE